MLLRLNNKKNVPLYTSAKIRQMTLIQIILTLTFDSFVTPLLVLDEVKCEVRHNNNACGVRTVESAPRRMDEERRKGEGDILITGR